MSGLSSNSYGSENRPSCKHGLCHLGTSFTIENPGRRYWGCPLYKQGCGCAFFQWIEAPYEGSVRTALLKIIRKLEFAERENEKIKEEKQKIEEEMKNMKVELDGNLVKLKAENQSLKHALKWK